MAATKKVKKKPQVLVTLTGHTVDDLLDEYRVEIKHGRVTMELFDQGKATFDRAVSRARDFSLLANLSYAANRPADRDFLTHCRDEHARLAVSLAKLLWKME